MVLQWVFRSISLYTVKKIANKHFKHVGANREYTGQKKSGKFNISMVNFPDKVEIRCHSLIK